MILNIYLSELCGSRCRLAAAFIFYLKTLNLMFTNNKFVVIIKVQRTKSIKKERLK